jgi:hypothetical protein
MKTSLGVAPTVHPISLVEGHLWDAEQCVVYRFDAEHELYGEGDWSVPTALSCEKENWLTHRVILVATFVSEKR